MNGKNFLKENNNNNKDPHAKKKKSSSFRELAGVKVPWHKFFKDKCKWTVFDTLSCSWLDINLNGLVLPKDRTTYHNCNGFKHLKYLVPTNLEDAGTLTCDFYDW